MLKHGRRLLGKSQQHASFAYPTASCTTTAQSPLVLPSSLPAFLVPAWTNWDDPSSAGKLSGPPTRSRRPFASARTPVPGQRASRRTYATSTSGRNQQAARYAEQSQHTPLSSAFLRDFVVESAPIAQQEHQAVASTSKASALDEATCSTTASIGLSRQDGQGAELAPQEPLDIVLRGINKDFKGKGKAKDQEQEYLGTASGSIRSLVAEQDEEARLALWPVKKASTDGREQCIADAIDVLNKLATLPPSHSASDSPAKNHLPRALLPGHFDRVQPGAEGKDSDAQAAARARLWLVVRETTEVLATMIARLGDQEGPDDPAPGLLQSSALVAALAAAVDMKTVAAKRVIAFCLGRASAAGKQGSQELRREVEKAVLLQYWLDVCQPPETPQSEVAPAAQGSDTQQHFGAQDRKALFQFLRNFFIGSDSHPALLSVLPQFLQLHAHARSLMSTAHLQGFNLLETCASLSTQISEAHQAERLLAVLTTRQAVAYAGYQNNRNVREYDEVVVEMSRTHLSSLSAYLPSGKMQQLTRRATASGLPRLAAALFVQAVSLLHPPDGSSADILNDGRRHSLALLASQIAAGCLSAGREEDAKGVLKSLDGLVGSGRGERAGPWRSIWQRRLQVIFKEGHRASGVPTLIADIDAILAEMDISGVSIDNYFVASLYRGIADSALPLKTAVELFHGVVQSLARYSGDGVGSDSRRLAVAQADLALFERAAAENAQLPWIPLVEQDRLLLQLSQPLSLLTTSASSGPSTPRSDRARLKDVSHRLTILATILRHGLLRHDWSQALHAYEGVLEVYQGELLANAGRAINMRLQRILQGCFVRMLVGLLKERRLEDTACVMRMTLQYLGAHHISPRVISRVLLAACSPRYYTSVRPVKVSNRRKARASATTMPAVVEWDALSCFLRLARDWAEDRQNRPLLKDGISFDVDAGSRPRKAIREVFSFWNHTDALAGAALQALFLSRSESAMEQGSDRVTPRDGFQQVLDTLSTLGADVHYLRLWQRVVLAAENMRLSEVTPASGEWSWRVVSPDLRKMCLDADERRRKEAARYLTARRSDARDEDVTDSVE